MRLQESYVKERTRRVVDSTKRTLLVKSGLTRAEVLPCCLSRDATPVALAAQMSLIQRFFSTTPADNRKSIIFFLAMGRVFYAFFKYIFKIKMQMVYLKYFGVFYTIL